MIKNWSIGRKIAASFIVIVALVVICGIVSIWGVLQLGGEMAFIFNNAWAASDGAMEGTIFLELQMLKGEQLVNGYKVQENKQEIQRLSKEAQSAIQRMIDSQIVDNKILEDFSIKMTNYNTSLTALISNYENYIAEQTKFEKQADEFVALFAQMEEIGDAAVEFYENSPTANTSWNTGLSRRWRAADGIMESRIQYLLQQYNLEAILAGHDYNSHMTQLNIAIDEQKSASSRMIDSGFFNLKGTGIFSSRNLSAYYQDYSNIYFNNITNLLEKFKIFESSREKYLTESSNFLDEIAVIEETGDEAVETRIQPMLDLSNGIFVIVLAVVIISIIVAIILGVSLSNMLTKPILTCVNHSDRLATGDLSFQINIDRDDETGKLMASFKQMMESLQNIVGDVRNASEYVSSGSQQLSSSAQQMSQGATEQASAAEQVSSSMEEMSSNIRQNAENAMQTEKIAQLSSKNANESGQAVSETVEAMREISSKISIIEEIARQTNMLALNAAIEAARAGEQGKGFAVVASEVKKLAERSKNAAQEINELSISSVEIAAKAGDMLKQLVPDISKTAELVQEISAASSEQTRGADQISRAIIQLDKVTQQNASSSEEIASTAEELASQSIQLQKTIAFFKVNKTFLPIKEAPEAQNIPNRDIKISQSDLSIESKKEENNNTTGITIKMDNNAEGDTIDNDFEKY